MNGFLLLQTNEVTLYFGVGLTIRSEPWVVAVSKPSPPPSIDRKEKRVHSPSSVEGARKAEKSRESPSPLDLASSSSQALIMEKEAKVRATLNLGDIPPADVSEALEGGEEGPVVVMVTQVEADVVWASMVESLMWVTRSTVKAQAAMAKVMRAIALVIDTGKGRETRPFAT